MLLERRISDQSRSKNNIQLSIILSFASLDVLCDQSCN